MAKEPVLMVAVEQVDSWPKGTRLLSDDPVVRTNPRLFIPFSEGDRAVNIRLNELRAEAVRGQERAQAEQRAERIRQGARPLASDDAMTEAAKRAVRENDSL